jgi:hypothetical protein
MQRQRMHHNRRIMPTPSAMARSTATGAICATCKLKKTMRTHMRRRHPEALAAAAAVLDDNRESGPQGGGQRSRRRRRGWQALVCAHNMLTGAHQSKLSVCGVVW